MSYTSKDIKNIVAEILENKKDKGGVKSLYFVEYYEYEESKKKEAGITMRLTKHEQNN